VVHHDLQGSVRGVTSSAGAKVERTIYNPYGNWDDVQLTWRNATLTDPANPTERSAASTPPQNRPFAQASCAASCAGPPPSWSLKV